MKKVLNPVEFYLDLLMKADIKAWGQCLLYAALDCARDTDASTLYSSRIDGLLDPFWRHP